MAKQIAIHLYNGLLLSQNNKKQITDKYRNTDESQMYCAEWNKPVSKATYCMIPFIQHSGKGKTIGTVNKSAIARRMRQEDKYNGASIPFALMPYYPKYGP